MAIQISGSQIKNSSIVTTLLANNAITPAKMDLTQSYDFSSGTVSVAAPSADSHAATKSYVDNLLSGLHWKESVKVATTGSIPATYNNGSSGVGATLTGNSSGAIQIDGVNLSVGDRVLVKDQSGNEFQNGIYEVTNAGSVSEAAVLERTKDADEASEFTAMAVFVLEGTTNADAGFVLSSDGVSAIGTDSIVFVQFSGAGQVSAGDGLQKTGNELSVLLDASAGIQITNGALDLKLDGGILTKTGNGLTVSAGGIGETELASAAVTSGKIANGAVGSTQLAGNSVTSAKLADGAVSTSQKLADGVVTSQKIGNGAVGSIQIAANAVTSAKLNSDVVSDGLQLDVTTNAIKLNLDGSSLAVDSLGLKVADSGIDTQQLADGAVTSQKIGNNAVGSNQLADGAVSTSQKLADGVVTTAKIADNAITPSKLGFQPYQEEFSANGTDTTFEMANAALIETIVSVYKNGLRMQYKATPTGSDEYKVDFGGAGGASRVIFGAAPASSDVIYVDYWG